MKRRPVLKFTLLFLFAVATSNVDARTWTDANGLIWEDEVEEIIEPDDHLGVPINFDDESQFDDDFVLAAPNRAPKPLKKKIVDPYESKACAEIKEKIDLFPQEPITRTTQYFTPVFRPGRNGGLQKKDRRDCINIEGSCIVGNYLYTWAEKKKPWGQRFVRSKIPFKFGKGSGKSYYNKHNALDPCRTIAADTSIYPVGTVIYIPSMEGKICPQNGHPVDGCFIVGDVGEAIQGQGRFDLFTGECLNYNKNNHTCSDSFHSAFTATKDDTFYVIGRHNILAKNLREEADLHISNDWRMIPILPIILEKLTQP